MASKKNDDLNEWTVNGSLNYYDKQRCKASAEDKKLAASMGSCQWNIISNHEDHEIYFRNARNDDHYIDAGNQATSEWWTRRRRVRRPGSDDTHTLDSRLTAQSLMCPPTAGKRAEAERIRSLRQICQAEAPVDYARFSARRDELTPRTPEKVPHEKRIPFQEQKQDCAPPPVPRTENRSTWLGRRHVPRIKAMPPPQLELFKDVDQLRCEHKNNVQGVDFAKQHTHARHAGFNSARLTEEKTYSSRQRMEPISTRDVTSWPWQSDKLTRHDPFYVKPMQRSGNSSVKHDIVSNERRNFWY